MGALADAAKKNSKFLMIAKGASAVVRYEGFQLIPNERDPDLQVAQYKLNEDGTNKYWKNGNSKIMMLFDKLPIGTWVRITRNPWINKDETEDTSKSTYIVDIANKDGKVGIGSNDVAWDEEK